MELHEIEVTIDAKGHVEVQVRGIKGMSCTEVTKALEEALGGKLEHRALTHEAYEQPPTQASDSQKNLLS